MQGLRVLSGSVQVPTDKTGTEILTLYGFVFRTTCTWTPILDNECIIQQMSVEGWPKTHHITQSMVTSRTSLGLIFDSHACISQRMSDTRLCKLKANSTQIIVKCQRLLYLGS